MLRLMLDAHPELSIPPETYFIPRADKAWFRARRPHRQEDRVEALTEAITGFRRWPDFHLDADAYRDCVRERRPETPGEAIRCFYEMYAEKMGKPRWGDKTPYYLRKMDVIRELLPEARFVHVLRDGRAVALSIKDLWFGPSTIEECAEHWVQRIDEARDTAKCLQHYMEVRYEDLVREPESQLRRIAEFLELPFDPAMVRFHEHVDERIAVETPPDEVAPDGRVVSTEERERIMVNVSRPPDPTRIDRWRTEIDPAERGAFEAIAGERLAELGYPV
jgi:hypothetical protein